MANIPVVYFDPEKVAVYLIQKFNEDNMSQEAKDLITQGIGEAVSSIKSILLFLRESSQACKKLLSSIIVTDVKQFEKSVGTLKAKKSVISEPHEKIKIESLVDSAQTIKNFIDENYNMSNIKLSILSSEEQQLVARVITTACIECLSDVLDYISEIEEKSPQHRR